MYVNSIFTAIRCSPVWRRAGPMIGAMLRSSSTSINNTGRWIPKSPAEDFLLLVQRHSPLPTCIYPFWELLYLLESFHHEVRTIYLPTRVAPSQSGWIDCPRSRDSHRADHQQGHNAGAQHGQTQLLTCTCGSGQEELRAGMDHKESQRST